MKMKSKVYKEVVTHKNNNIIVRIGDTLELVDCELGYNCLVKFINDDTFTIPLGTFYMQPDEFYYE